MIRDVSQVGSGALSALPDVYAFKQKPEARCDFGKSDGRPPEEQHSGILRQQQGAKTNNRHQERSVKTKIRQDTWNVFRSNKQIEEENRSHAKKNIAAMLKPAEAATKR
jgi:hypothetical protein